MRILIATQTYWPDANGQSVFTTHLAEGLVRAGHEVQVVMPAESGHHTVNTHRGVVIHRVPAVAVPQYPSVRLTPLPGISVRHILDEFQPHLVHIQDHYFLSASVVRAARARGLPLIGTNHFLPANLSRNFPIPTELRPFVDPAVDHLLWWHMLSLYNRLDRVIAPTETAADILRAQRLIPPVQVISCGVDTAVFHPRPAIDRAATRRKYGLAADKALFLFVGRVDREKRLDILTEAAARLARTDFQVAIAGKGLHVTKLQAHVEALRLAPRVRLLGFVPPDDLPLLLQAADFFAMPSEAELQSIATLEAMAMGLPVLAAEAGALPELVVDNVNGCLFRPGNAEDAARRMMQMLDAPAHWVETVRKANQVKAVHHSVANTVQRYARLYETVIARQVQRSLERPSERNRKKLSWRGLPWKS
jgi:glycosyltransferase involved in cell wall biosynthesis